MSNLHKAERVIAKHLGSSDPYSITSGQAAEALEAAGLLAPDLPRPTRDRLWQTSALELGIRTVHYAADQVVVHTSGGRLHTHYKQARDLAMALLAACEYAEKEQDNEC